VLRKLAKRNKTNRLRQTKQFFKVVFTGAREEINPESGLSVVVKSEPPLCICFVF